jgi:hypothetical protein
MKTRLILLTIFAFGSITLDAQTRQPESTEIISDIVNLSGDEHTINNNSASCDNKYIYDKQAYGLFKTQSEGDNFVSVNLESGDTEIIMEDVPTVGRYGSEFIDSVLYEVKCVSLPNELYLIKPDGERELVGEITGTSSKIRGLAYDYDNNIVYAAAKVANANADSYLYTLNMQTLELTLTGTIFTGSLTIKDIEYADGKMYGVEWENSSLWEIDMQTATGTYIGVLTGWYFNYNQSISYDKNSGIMYGMFFDNHAKFCTVNLNTGAATLIKQYGTNDRFYNFSVQPSAIKNITSFNIANQVGETEIDNQLFTVTVYMPSGTNVTNLAPEIEVSGDVTGIEPQSGVPQDFSSPVEYTLTGKYGNEQIWTASVVLLSNENEITSFQIPEQIGETIIDDNLHTVFVEVPEGTIVTALTPEITISENAVIDPENGTPQDFTEPFVYTVTAENGDQQEWTVTVDVLTGITSANSGGFKIYPNPSNGIINLTVPHVRDENLLGFIGLEISNTQGKIICTKEFAPSEIDLSNQPNGIYFIKIKTETNIYTQKIIIH